METTLRIPLSAFEAPRAKSGFSSEIRHRGRQNAGILIREIRQFLSGKFDGRSFRKRAHVIGAYAKDTLSPYVSFRYRFNGISENMGDGATVAKNSHPQRAHFVSFPAGISLYTLACE